MVGCKYNARRILQMLYTFREEFFSIQSTFKINTYMYMFCCKRLLLEQPLSPKISFFSAKMLSMINFTYMQWLTNSAAVSVCNTVCECGRYKQRNGWKICHILASISRNNKQNNRLKCVREGNPFNRPSKKNILNNLATTIAVATQNKPTVCFVLNFSLTQYVLLSYTF